MTILEKRQLLIKKIQEIPDDLIEKVEIFFNEISEKKDLPKAEFEKFLEETTIKYKKVWEALA
jgi:hypothetical protein